MKNTVNLSKEDLIKHVHNKLEKGYNLGDIVTVLFNTFESMKELLRENEKITIKNFGTFEKRIRKECIKRNPRTQEPVLIKAQEKICFKMSKNFLVKE